MTPLKPRQHGAIQILYCIVLYCPIATPADHVATDHSGKLHLQDGGLPVRSLTNHSKVASLWLVTTKQVVGDHQWRVVCCNVEYPTFSMQNRHPSNVIVPFWRPSCDYNYTGGFEFVYKWCLCAFTQAVAKRLHVTAAYWLLIDGSSLVCSSFYMSMAVQATSHGTDGWSDTRISKSFCVVSWHLKMQRHWW